jgi:hypothetical protein
MNKRIDQIADQVMDEFGNEFKDSGIVVSDEFFERFAELIVQECVQVCLSQRDPANLNYKPSERFAEAVKQHFGVES